MARTPQPTADTIREVGLKKYPGAHLKSPWPGHLDLAVKDKTFAHLSVPGEPFRMSVKLPHSSSIALMLPFTQPTPYGLGKSGWVSIAPPKNDAPPLEMLLAWVDESYRAIAPKKLIAQLDAGAAAPAPRATSTAPKKAAPKKAAPTKAAPKKAAPKKAAPKKLVRKNRPA